MSSLVLDAGAFLAVERSDRAMLARLRVAQREGLDLKTNAMVVAQVWRGTHGRSASLARLLRAVDVRAVDERIGREAGVLLGRAGTRDAVDASLVLMAHHGDRIVTSDPRDIRHLAETAGVRVLVVPC